MGILFGHAFKIRIVNVQNVIEVPRNRIKGLDNIGLIVMVKRIHEISFVYRVEKSYVDKLVARNPLHFNLLSTSPEFFIDQNQFLFEVSYTVSQYRMT